jgi:3',5'-cyclic-AMP phosphodiesterase
LGDTLTRRQTGDAAVKLIQITDLHLMPQGSLLAGLDPLMRLRACIADINAHHADADYVAITGDLSQTGETATYELLRQELEALVPPHGLTTGNHDRREALLEVFPDQGDGNGFVQRALDLADGRIILLDTLHEGHDGGLLGDVRLGWLDRALSGAGDRPVYIFMHHPPMDIGMPLLDRIRLADGEEFYAVLARHRNVRHIFAGHVHRLISGTYRGISFSVLRSTNHQADLDFSPDRVANTHEAPLYAVILADADGVVVHTRDFTDQSRFYA